MLTVSMLCDIAKVSRSGYYSWVKSEDIREKKRDKIEKILKLFLKYTNIEDMIKVQEEFI